MRPTMNTSDLDGKRLHPLWPSMAVLGGLALTLISERNLAGATSARIGVSVVVAILLFAAAAARMQFLLSSPENKRTTAQVLFLGTVGVLFALLLYGAAAVWFPEASEDNRSARSLLWGLWPVALLVSALPLFAVELAVLPSAFAPHYELNRIRSSARRALTLAMIGGALGFTNLIVSQHDHKWELAAENQVKASPETLAAVARITQPVEVVLFFPAVNEIADQVERYLAPITKTAPNITVRRVDIALDEEISKRAGVDKNGTLALLRGKTKEVVPLGLNKAAARYNLRQLDQNFLKKLVQVSSQKRTVYFVTGHGERAWDRAAPDDTRIPVGQIKRWLEASQFTVRELGLAQGLQDKLPDDAELVFILGPEKPFLSGEVEQILKGFETRPLRVFIALQSGPAGSHLEPLLEPLGLKFDPSYLGNRSHAVITRTPKDEWNIFSDSFTAHESVKDIKRLGRIAVVLPQTGALEIVDKPPMPGVKTAAVLNAIAGTYKDGNMNYTWDAPDEPRGTFPLAAAVTRTSTKAGTGKSLEARAFVLASIDAFSDQWVTLHEPNRIFFAQIVQWLQEGEEPIVPTLSKSDVKIVHKKDEDALTFYGTIFGVPLLVLGVGLFAVRRRERQ
jgi:hypothetical protein